MKKITQPFPSMPCNMALSSTQDRLGLAFFSSILVEMDAMYYSRCNYTPTIIDFQDGKIFVAQLVLWQIQYTQLT